MSEQCRNMLNAGDFGMVKCLRDVGHTGSHRHNEHSWLGQEEVSKTCQEFLEKVDSFAEVPITENNHLKEEDQDVQ